MNRKVIISDFFGVVVDRNADRFFQKYVSKQKASELTYHYCHPGDLGQTTFAQIMKDIARDFRFDYAFVEHELLYGPKLHQEYVSCLRSLKEKGHRIILLSNATDFIVEHLMRLYQIEDVFEKTYISYSSGLIKPEESAFLGVLQACQIDAKDAIFIDDSPLNTHAATKVGITSILYEQDDQATRDLLSKING